MKEVTSLLNRCAWPEPGEGEGGNYHQDRIRELILLFYLATIYTGAGCNMFWFPFFRQKIHFRVSFLVRLRIDINFRMLFFEK